jgi:ribulose bisphosphate carboxylase small subunit
MTRPTFFLRINGLAATSDFTASKMDRYLDRCIASRPDAVIDLVQVDPADGREICSSVVYRPAIAENA